MNSMKAKLYFGLALFLCAAHYSNGYAGLGLGFGVGGGYYWERASDGVNAAENRISSGGAFFGEYSWGEAIPWNGGMSINFMGGGKSMRSDYSVNGGNGIPLISWQNESIADIKFEILFT